METIAEICGYLLVLSESTLYIHTLHYTLRLNYSVLYIFSKYYRLYGTIVACFICITILCIS